MTGRARLLRCYPPAWRERYGDDLRLIIEDHTDWEIPWELFWLTPPAGSPSPGGWLGGRLVFVLGTRVLDEGRKR